MVQCPVPKIRFFLIAIGLSSKVQHFAEKKMSVGREDPEFRESSAVALLGTMIAASDGLIPIRTPVAGRGSFEFCFKKNQAGTVSTPRV